VLNFAPGIEKFRESHFYQLTVTLFIMRALSFLSRFAFICNILFVVCLVFQRIHDPIDSTAVKATIITLGWFISPFLNLAVCIRYGIVLISKRILTVAIWLVVTNFLFLLLQIFVHFILPS